MGNTAIYKRRNNTQNNTKTQNTQNRKHTYKKKKANIIDIKKQKKAVPTVLTVQERRDKQQQCQTQYSAVHDAGCV